MRKYLEPLIIFVTLEVGLLVAMLFFPALKVASDELASDTAAMASTFWGWAWVVSATRFLVFISFQLGILWVTAKSFLGLRH